MKSIFVLFLLFGSITQAQQNKVIFSKNQNTDKEVVGDKFVVIGKDTLVGSYSKLSDSQIFRYCDILNNEEAIRNYKNIVFNNLNCNQYKRVVTKQWNSEIIIYLDKELPKSTAKAFKKFIKSLPEINNLRISSTRNKNESNYLITTTEEKIFSDNHPRESYAYNHITYNLYADKNSKFYGGILKINLNAMTDRRLIIKKLKQFFFMSLGQFTLDNRLKVNSLLNYDYDNNSKISEEDVELLLLHYMRIHDVPLNCYFFSKYIKKKQLLCTNED